jgi:O-succinylbenzoate synthase
VIEITRITLREIVLPLVEPFRSADGTVSDRRLLLLAFTDGDGFETWSECVAQERPGYSSETVGSCWRAITEWLGRRLLDSQFASSSAVYPQLARDVSGHRMAMAALEMGAWGIEADRLGIPLAELIARESEISRDRRTPPRTWVETGISLGMQAGAEALMEQSRTAVAAGYRRIKIKIEPGRDVIRVRAAREAVGPGFPLSADANCSYATVDGYTESLRALDEFGLTMIEQPLGHDDLARHAQLAQAISTPICLDESITGASSMDEMLALESRMIVNLKPGRVGGLSQAVAIHDMCARAGVRLWCGGMLESGVGRAYNVALASLPHFTEPGDLSPSDRYWERDVVRPPWAMDSAGRVRVPLDRPGLGVEVDVGYVDDVTVRVAELRQH